MHAPEHSLVVLVHAGWQASPLQLTVPPVGTWHAEHEVGPQFAVDVLSTHLPVEVAGHWWKAFLQLIAQLPLMHAAEPLGSVGQLVHDVPHAVASSSAAHRFPQR
jgi:hypothetical protein